MTRYHSMMSTPNLHEHTEFASTQTPDWQQIPNTAGPTACYLPHISSCGLEGAENFAGKDGKCAHLAGDGYSQQCQCDSRRARGTGISLQDGNKDSLGHGVIVEPPSTAVIEGL